MEFVLRQGTILRSSGPDAPASRPGEGITAREAFWFANGNIPFFGAHLQRLGELLAFFGHPWPPELPPDHEILRLFLRLVNKNKAFMGGWVRTSFHFSHHTSHYSADVVPHPERNFPMEQEGRPASVSPFIKYSMDPLARFPLSSEPLLNAEHFRMDEAIKGIAVFLNEKRMVTEASGGALFCISKNNLITPAPATGAIRIIYTDHLLRAASLSGFQVTETDRLTLPDVMNCEEVFTVSEEEGFRWITGIDDKRFVKTKTSLIWKQFNRTAFPAP